MQKKLFLLSMILLLSCASGVGAQEKKGGEASAPKGTKVTWSDGQNQVSAYILSDYVVELGSGPSTIKSLDRGAETKLQKGNVKLHKISDSGLKQGLSKGELPTGKNAGGIFIPALSTTGDEAGLVVPVGGVIVELPKSTDEAGAKAWASKNGLRLVKKVVGSFFLVESAPGLASIDLANSLKDKGAVSATPELWINAGPK